jgi:hypothetical protein
MYELIYRNILNLQTLENQLGGITFTIKINMNQIFFFKEMIIKNLVKELNNFVVAKRNI